MGTHSPRGLHSVRAVRPLFGPFHGLIACGRHYLLLDSCSPFLLLLSSDPLACLLFLAARGSAFRSSSCLAFLFSCLANLTLLAGGYLLPLPSCLSSRLVDQKIFKALLTSPEGRYEPPGSCASAGPSLASRPPIFRSDLRAFEGTRSTTSNSGGLSNRPLLDGGQLSLDVCPVITESLIDTVPKIDEFRNSHPGKGSFGHLLLPVACMDRNTVHLEHRREGLHRPIQVNVRSTGQEVPMSNHSSHQTIRDAYVIVEALAFTIEAFQRLPIEHRPDSNVAEMKRIVESLARQDGTLQQAQSLARRRLEIILAARSDDLSPSLRAFHGGYLPGTIAVGRTPSIIPRIATLSGRSFASSGCSGDVFLRDLLQHFSGGLFCGVQRRCRECRCCRWLYRDGRRRQFRGSWGNKRCFWVDDNRCRRGLVGSYAIIFADCGLHQPMKGDGKDDVDPKAESNSSCQSEVLPL
jgi:hypothetical protein